MMRDLDMFNEFLAEERPELPPMQWHWVICDRCRGHGFVRGYPGVYTQDDFASGEVDLDDYMEHTRDCPDCEGSGKERVPTAAPGSETERLFRHYLQEINESRAIEAQERRMGA